LLQVDAATMETLEEVDVPAAIGFTTHGEWYPHL
jgi:hypothetical protein